MRSMETTFYEDSQFRNLQDDIKGTKRPATLDLDSNGNLTKKQRFTAILTSPDLNMLKLASPELERFIIAQNGAITTTPTPTQFLFPKNVTEEQEQYARGFVDALAQLHQTSIEYNFLQPQTTSAVSTTSSLTTSSATALSRLYSGLIPLHLTSSVVPTSVVAPESTKSYVPSTSVTSVTRPSSVDSTSSSSYQGSGYLPIPQNVKEELQMVPSDSSNMSPPVSPINMESQERIKQERKRARNRDAAKRCRMKKLHRIAQLEEKVKQLKNENTDLGVTASKLKEQVCHLKQQVMDHVKNGCQIMLTHAF